MISAQWYKVLNDLWSNKTRTVLIVLSIAVGLMAMGATMSANTLLSRGLFDNFLFINYSSGSLGTKNAFDKDFVRSVRAIPGIKDVDARRVFNTRVLAQNQKWQSMQVFSVPDFEDIRVNKIISLSGDWPPPRHQILMDKYSLTILGLQVGDEVQVEISSNKSRRVRIAGTVRDLSVSPSRMGKIPYAYADSDTLTWLGAPAGYNELEFLMDGQQSNTNIQAVLYKIKDKAEKAGNVVPTYLVTEETPISKPMQTILMIMQAAGILSLFLSIFLIYNTISAMIAQQIKLIGAMKAIGAQTSQISSMYLVLVIVYGFIALLFAVPFAAIGSHFISGFFSDFFNFTISGNTAQPVIILFQVVIAIFIPVLASLYPLIDGLHITTTQALSGQKSFAQSGKKRILIDRFLSGANLWITRFWLLRPFILAVRNLFRQKLRLILTMITLVLGGAVFIAVLSLRSTIFSYIDLMNQMKRYDIQVDFNQSYSLNKLKQVGTFVNGVGETDTWLQTLIHRVRPDGTESKQFPLVAVHTHSQLVTVPYMIQGRWLSPDDKNVLVITSSVLRDEPDIKVGQEITLYIAGRERTFQVVGICLGERGETVYANIDFITPILHTGNSSNNLLIQLDPRSCVREAQLQDSLEAYYKNRNYNIASIKTMDENKKATLGTFDSILTLLIMMAILLAIVGGLGLMGTMSINVIERTREIGIMRSIGASNRDVIWVFLLEGLSIGLLSCLFAIPLSFPISNAIASPIGKIMSNYSWSGVFNPIGAVIWVMIVIILSILANYLPARGASQLTVREVLAYE
jgi:putative ABC transport system permease protein